MVVTNLSLSKVPELWEFARGTLKPVPVIATPLRVLLMTRSFKERYGFILGRKRPGLRAPIIG